MAYEKNLKTIFSIFVFLQIFLGVCKANGVSVPYNNSIGLENYVEQYRRQYVAQIENYEFEISNFRSNYQRQLLLIEANRDLVIMKITEVEQKFYPLELLSAITRHCVEKYRKILILPSLVRSRYSSCISSATSAVNTILSSAESTYRLLNNYFNNNFKAGISNCEKKYNETQRANRTICVVELLNSFNAYFLSNLYTFNTQMDTARCSADTRLKQTVECFFPTINEALNSTAVSSRLVEDCIVGVGKCKICPEQENSTIIIQEPQCPNVITVITDIELYNNATIRNPFNGLGHLSCVLINFLPTNAVTTPNP